MKISFSQHALNQLKERNLTKTSALKAVSNPDKVTNQIHNRFLAIKSIERSGKNYLIIVAYDKHNQNIEIVTVFLTSKIRKYL